MKARVNYLNEKYYFNNYMRITDVNYMRITDVEFKIIFSQGLYSDIEAGAN